MKNDNYLIPANTKSGGLILNIFTVPDLIIFLIGILITVILLITLPLNTLLVTILALLPGGVATLLIMPIPNYHNILTLINEIKNFFIERRIYIWKGWCFYEYFDKEKK
ncbi:MAG: hypothetical protein PHQ89_02650 [Bacilli bacterium]|nr:hypothetical protein [Bacilli bacterium]